MRFEQVVRRRRRGTAITNRRGGQPRDERHVLKAGIGGRGGSGFGWEEGARVPALVCHRSIGGGDGDAMAAAALLAEGAHAAGSQTCGQRHERRGVQRGALARALPSAAALMVPPVFVPARMATRPRQSDVARAWRAAARPASATVTRPKVRIGRRAVCLRMPLWTKAEGGGGCRLEWRSMARTGRLGMGRGKGCGMGMGQLGLGAAWRKAQGAIFSLSRTMHHYCHGHCVRACVLSSGQLSAAHTQTQTTHLPMIRSSAVMCI